MPVDASIYGQIQQPQQINPLASLAQAYQVKGMQSQIDKADRAEAQQNRLLALVQGPDFQKLDAQGKANALQGVGDFENAGKVITSAAAANKDQRSADQTGLEMAIKRHDAMSGAMMGLAQDPSQAQQVIGQLVQGGIMDPAYGQKILQSAAQAPDPSAFFKQGAMAAVSAKDQLAQQIQQQAQGVTMRGQDMTQSTAQRGQDMADARSRESNANGRLPSGYRLGADGQSLEFIPGGPADPNTKPAGGKPLNDTQAKALQFGTRMQASEDILGGLADQGIERPGLIKRVAEATPFIGSGAGALTNWTQSSGQQQVEQAQRDFINAALRRESGAAISEGEFVNAKQQYFPQPGDSDAVKAQKKANRELATRGILAEVPDSENRVAQVRGTPAKPAASAPAGKPDVGGMEAELRRRGLLK